ncbi:MAG TPA: hypothetical protein VK024_05870, partial [Actinomycetaceae bacterium]|nr:hypothetical protein [Actinomycetaceae bacterium]
MSTQEHPDPISATFGANEWLIEELFEKYQQDPNLVDPAWWDFFKDYQPNNGDQPAPATRTASPSAATRQPGEDRPTA